MPPTYPGPISKGEVWWADKVRSPDNTWEQKDRRVLVIYPDSPVSNTSPSSIVWALGISTQPHEEKHRQRITIRLPDTETYPGVKYGLDKPCWAVGSWFLALTACYLDRPAGSEPVPSDLLVRAYEIVRGLKRKPLDTMKCVAGGPVRCDYCSLSGRDAGQL